MEHKIVTAANFFNDLRIYGDVEIHEDGNHIWFIDYIGDANSGCEDEYECHDITWNDYCEAAAIINEHGYKIIDSSAEHDFVSATFRKDDMNKNELGQDQYAHHGDPAIFERDMKNFADLILWMRIVKDEAANGFHKNDSYINWFPIAADCLKSRLFWRIRARKPILKHAPPTAMSCPWYELIEEPDRPHWVYDPPTIHYEWDGREFNPPQVSISGTSWFDLIEKINDNHYIVEFKPWIFDLYKAPRHDVPRYDHITGTSKLVTVDGWWLQRRKEENENLYIDVVDKYYGLGYYSSWGTYPKETKNELE